MLHLSADTGGSPEALAAVRARYPRPVDMDSTPGIAILTRSVFEVPDTEDPSALEISRELGRLFGIRNLFTVPMLREGEAIGAIVVSRREPGAFADREVALLKTFADQAVIAIENVRLFKELDARNTDLAESLEQQTATGEILRVISSAQTDIQPVFEAIASNALRLCDATFSTIFRFDGELVHLEALRNVGGAVARTHGDGDGRDLAGPSGEVLGDVQWNHCAVVLEAVPAVVDPGDPEAARFRDLELTPPAE